jgi:hypothetical protein
MAATKVMELPAMSWAPVVYGRTAVADTWWQAIPEGADDSGWLVGVVRAVFAGGSELDASPRFLLAQDSAHRIVGIACRARDLSVRMCSDGGRELSCFVGWMTSRSAVAESGALEGPTFADLQQRYVQWAAPVYEEVMSPVWDLPHSPFRRPAATYPVAPPWDGTVYYGIAKYVPRPAEGLWPVPTWPHVWAAALVTAEPFTCVVGWQHARSARGEDVTHLGAADAPPREAPLTPTLVALAQWPLKANDLGPADADLEAADLEPADLEPADADLEIAAAQGLVDEPAPPSAEDSPDLPDDGPAWFPVPARLARVRWLSPDARREISVRLPASVLHRFSARLPRLQLVPRRRMLGAILALAATVIVIVIVIVIAGAPLRNRTVSLLLTMHAGFV